MHEHPPSEPLALLKEGAAALNLELAPGTLEHLQIYLEELKLWNAKTNLTGLKTDRDIVIKHFLDSLAVLPWLDGAASLVDLGSGGGFPGMVLKLALPQLALTLVEARERKAAFLEYLAARLRLTGVEVVQVHLTPFLAKKREPKVRGRGLPGGLYPPPPAGVGRAAWPRGAWSWPSRAYTWPWANWRRPGPPRRCWAWGPWSNINTISPSAASPGS